jgi:uncharacterized protein (UPF0261 family)
MPTIVVFGTLDTKGAVHQFIAEQIQRQGYKALLVDVSLRGEPTVPPDIGRKELLRRAEIEGGRTATDLPVPASAMGLALGRVLRSLFLQKRLAGVLSVGGRIGMQIATEALRQLPFGIPSALVTHVPNHLAGLVESGKDVTVFSCPIKPEGLNRIVRPILKRALRAIVSMVEVGRVARRMSDRPLIAASCMGYSLSGVERVKRMLEREGYDVVCFTRKGAGGRVMESVISAGLAVGVLDLSTAEIAEEVLGGVFDASGEWGRRLEAAGRRGVAAVVAAGGLDAVSLQNGSIPARFEGRAVLEDGERRLARTNVEECREIGRTIAERLNRYLGPVTVCLPMRGVSALSGAGQSFHDPEADRALADALEGHLRKGIRVLRMKANGEDAPFVERCVVALLENIRRRELDSEMLRRVPFLKNVSEVVVRELARLLEAISLSEGEWLKSSEGGAGGLYCISQGALEVIKEESPVGRLGAGEVYGARELVFGRDGRDRPFQLRALEDSEVLFLGCRAFERFCEDHPELEESIAALLTKGVWRE